MLAAMLIVDDAGDLLARLDELDLPGDVELLMLGPPSQPSPPAVDVRSP